MEIPETGMTTEQRFLAVYDEHMPRIFRHITGRVSSEEVARDIVSETFYKAWDHIRKGGEVQQMKSFCYKIANNLVIDYYRKKYRTDVPLEAAEDVQSETDGPARIEADVDKELLRERLAEMRGDYGAVLAYKYIDDMDIKEIAKLMGKSSSNIYVIIHRALKVLRHDLSKQKQ